MKNKLSFNKLLHSNCGSSLRSLSFADFDDFENLVSHNEAVEHSLSAKIKSSIHLALWYLTSHDRTSVLVVVWKL